MRRSSWDLLRESTIGLPANPGACGGRCPMGQGMRQSVHVSEKKKVEQWDAERERLRGY
jgi:hypothetical protein